jgi:AraC family transcriptional regulator
MSESTTPTTASTSLQGRIDSKLSANARGGRKRLPVWWARKVREYVDSHIDGRVLATDLGALVGLSETHFARSFKRAFGVSPYAFVIRRRLELAARYMLETDAPLSDIALQCGFTDQAHLGNRFREATGLSPAAWRRLRGPQESYRFSIELANE